MKGILLGWRKSPLQRQRLLLFDDRVEEVSEALLELEVRRLFFDEAQSVTVHRTFGSLIFAGLLFLALSLLLGGIALAQGGSNTLIVVAIPIGAFLPVLAFLLLCPPHLLKVHAPGQMLEAQLPSLPFRRERALRRLVDAIERYQREHALGSGDGSTPG